MVDEYKHDLTDEQIDRFSSFLSVEDRTNKLTFLTHVASFYEYYENLSAAEKNRLGIQPPHPAAAEGTRPIVRLPVKLRFKQRTSNRNSVESNGSSSGDSTCSVPFKKRKIFYKDSTVQPNKPAPLCGSMVPFKKPVPLRVTFKATASPVQKPVPSKARAPRKVTLPVKLTKRQEAIRNRKQKQAIFENNVGASAPQKVAVASLKDTASPVEKQIPSKARAPRKVTSSFKLTKRQESLRKRKQGILDNKVGAEAPKPGKVVAVPMKDAASSEEKPSKAKAPRKGVPSLKVGKRGVPKRNHKEKPKIVENEEAPSENLTTTQKRNTSRKNRNMTMKQKEDEMEKRFRYIEHLVNILGPALSKIQADKRRYQRLGQFVRED